LVVGLVIIMGLSIGSAVSGVGRGVKYLSNINLVLSIILLLVFVIFGSFIFSMTTYATALLDYILHFIQLSFGAYTPQSAAEFNAALPAAAQPFATDLYAAATNAWGSFKDFKNALTGGAVALSGSLAGNPAGRRFIGPGGSPSHLLWGCSWRASQRAEPCASSLLAVSSLRRWYVLPG
jgi:hypothetical protein